MWPAPPGPGPGRGPAPDAVSAPDTAPDKDADALFVPEVDTGADTTDDPTRCNSQTGLCALRYDEVLYATTHNAMSNAEDGWGLPNQNRSVLHQLDDGVRGFMLDLHEWEGQVQLCHGTCYAIGNRPLVEALVELDAWLDAHPREIVTIIFEDYVPAEDTAAVFEESGLLARCHAQPEGEPWPTLGEMVARDGRVVVFSDQQRGGFPWFHDTWSHCWETDWNVPELDDFDCGRNRGSAGNPLLILNHFLSRTVPDPAVAATANARDVLLPRIQTCWEDSGQVPNFVTVDFYDEGDVVPVVRELNAAQAARL